MRIDEYVEAYTGAKCERAGTVRVDRVGSRPCAEVQNRAIYADGGKWTGKCSISVEVDAFDDGFRDRGTIGDVPPVRGKYIRAVQGLHAASWRRGLRLRSP